jgi:hypothetical protein
MVMPVPGLEGVGMFRPAPSQIDMGMVGGFLDEVVVGQGPEGWQEENVQGDKHGQQKCRRCGGAFRTGVPGRPVPAW